MLLEDALDRRHSTTEFSERYVLSEQLNHIISAALKVPNFNNRYNFKIVILTHDSKKKLTIGRALSRYGKEHNDIKAKRQGECIKKASSLLLIYKEKSDIKTENDGDFITAGALGQNICLMATNLYLGTLWIDRVKVISDRVSNVLKGCKLFKNNPNLELCYGIILGYRDRRYSYLRDGAPESSHVEWIVR